MNTKDLNRLIVVLAEVKLYNAFCESCNIERDFNVDEYLDITLRGPFVNPEDLMNNM